MLISSRCLPKKKKKNINVIWIGSQDHLSGGSNWVSINPLGRPAYPKISKKYKVVYINGKKASNAPERKLIKIQPLETTAISRFQSDGSRSSQFKLQFNQNPPLLFTSQNSHTKHTHTHSLSLSQIFAFFFNLSLSVKFIIFALSSKPWKVLALSSFFSFAFVFLIQRFDLQEIVFVFL